MVTPRLLNTNDLVRQVVENVTALRALDGSADLPAVTVVQYSGSTLIGGGVFEWRTAAGTDDSGHRFNAGGHGTSGAGWQRVGVTPGVYRSENYGVVADGSTNDDTALARWYAAGQGNLMLLQAGVLTTTTGLTVAVDRTNIVGQGKQNSIIKMNPAAPGQVAVSFDKGTAVLYQCSLRGVAFASDNVTDAKVAVRASDTSELVLEDIAMLNWTGNTSIGIQLRGRELTAVKRVSVQADRPLSIEGNPNHTIDCDLLHLEDTYWMPLLSTGAGIHFDGPNVNITSFHTSGCNIVAGGKFGIYNAGGAASPALGVDIKGLRHEQSTDPTGYAVRWEQNTYSLSISDSQLSNTGGVYLRSAITAAIRDSHFEGVGGAVALDVDGCWTVKLDNFFRQTGAVSNMGAMVRQLTLPGYASNGGFSELWVLNLAAKSAYLGEIQHTYGTGSPEGVVTGNVGDIFHRTDGGSGTVLYVKESGTGNTGWVAVATGSGGITWPQAMALGLGV